MDVKQKSAAAAYEKAVDAGSYTAIRSFVTNYPFFDRLNEAKRVAEERLAFETASSVDTEESWADYLEHWPSEARADEARSRLESARKRGEEAWREASEARTAAGWAAFLALYPRGRRGPRAELKRREAVAFEAARASGRAALEDFLRMHGDGGLLAKDARRLIRQLAEEEAYQNAAAHDTSASWNLYLATHPSAGHSDEARDRLTALEDTAFASLLTSCDPAKGEQFLREFPQTMRRAEVVKLIPAWRDAQAARRALDLIEAGDGDAAAALVPSISDEEQRRDVNLAIDAWRDRKAWDAADHGGTYDALQGYLDVWPEGRWASKARKRLAKLPPPPDTEPADWDSAWEKGTVAAWDEYLAAHPRSPRLEDARHQRQEAAEYEQADAMDTPKMWRAFLKAWPDGRHRLDAQFRLRNTF